MVLRGLPTWARAHLPLPGVIGPMGFLLEKIVSLPRWVQLFMLLNPNSMYRVLPGLATATAVVKLSVPAAVIRPLLPTSESITPERFTQISMIFAPARQALSWLLQEFITSRSPIPTVVLKLHSIQVELPIV